MIKSVATGILAAALLLAAYLGLLGWLSGREYALDQFSTYRYYILGLAGGFGVQIALYSHLRLLVLVGGGSKKVVAVSGTTSTMAMLSCCTHYLANVLPVLGASGIVAFFGQYQVEFFWVGLAFNAAGIAYIASKVLSASREHTQCVHSA